MVKIALFVCLEHCHQHRHGFEAGPFSLPLPVKLFPITALFGELKGGIIPQPDVPKDSKFKRWVGKRFSNGN